MSLKLFQTIQLPLQSNRLILGETRKGHDKFSNYYELTRLVKDSG